MSWRPTEYEDLLRIEVPFDSCEADIREMMPDSDESRLMLRENARTWEDEGRIVAIVGVTPFWKGVGMVWTLLGVESKRRGVALTRGVLRFIDELHAARGYWRMEALTERGDETARVWITRLGFEYEGTKIAYGPRMESYDMYARVRI